jgi:hypothetical protein
MVNMTLSIPKELHDKLKKYTEIRWSEVARKSFENKVKNLERIDLFKDIQEADDNIKNKKYITHNALLKELGLENEI